MTSDRQLSQRLKVLMQSRTAKALFRVLIPLFAVGVSMTGGGLLMALSRVNPLMAYRELFKGAFGNVNSVCEIFTRAMPLGFCGLSVAIAHRGGLTNIGAEGQLYLGALGAALVVRFFPQFPRALMIPTILVAAAAFGAVWGAVPGILKARWRVNEFVNTVMMNYIGIYLINYLVSGPIREPTVTNYPQTARFVDAAWMPVLVPSTRLTVGLIVLMLLALAIYILLWKTSLGYQIRVVGHNPRAALYAGISTERILVATLALAGALAGVGGAVEVTSVQHRLIEGFSAGYGYTGIAVALLGRSHPFGVILAALFFGVLRTGRRAMESYSGVSFYLITILEALVVLAILASDFLARRFLQAQE